jgi:hypothetical protein
VIRVKSAEFKVYSSIYKATMSVMVRVEERKIVSVMVWVKQKDKDTAQYMGQLCRGQQIILRSGQHISRHSISDGNWGRQRIYFTMGNR